MRIRPTIAVPLGLGLVIGLAGCSGGNSNTVDDTVTPSHSGSASTVPSSGGTAPNRASQVLRFEAPADVSCTGDTATIEVTYATVDLTAVAFVVDGQPAAGATAPPTSGEYSVVVPCDDNVHTIQLIGSGPSGPAFASKAVKTRPT